MPLHRYRQAPPEDASAPLHPASGQKCRHRPRRRRYRRGPPSRPWPWPSQPETGSSWRRRRGPSAPDHRTMRYGTLSANRFRHRSRPENDRWRSPLPQPLAGQRCRSGSIRRSRFSSPTHPKPPHRRRADCRARTWRRQRSGHRGHAARYPNIRCPSRRACPAPHCPDPPATGRRPSGKVATPDCHCGPRADNPDHRSRRRRARQCRQQSVPSGIAFHSR